MNPPAVRLDMWRAGLSRIGRVLLFSWSFALRAWAVEAPSPIQLREVTRETGITFVHTDGSSGRRYIVETVCCGLVLLDYDGDGLRRL
ncbi:MAG: hypothetical protein KJ072_02300 [Verrucomicrobia bacterium]|nr:hypothetical protein [Verrucomicrobiota bacterium]